MKAIIIIIVFGIFYYTQYRHYVSQGLLRDLLVFSLLYAFAVGLIVVESMGVELPDVAWVTGKAVVSLFGVKVE